LLEFLPSKEAHSLEFVRMIETPLKFVCEIVGVSGFE
jgi:hypothetical protein